MKKKWLIILLLIVLLPAIEKTVANTLTGEAITGDATQQLGMNISVTGAPHLVIHSPENETYLTNNSLLLNYSVSDQHAVWYNLDGTANTTITSFIYFNTSEGTHALYLYANNSYGTRTKTVGFTINNTRFTILYEEYNGSTRGNSTDFILHTYDDLESLANITLENTDYGKILFNEIVNATADSDVTDNILDLDTNVNISLNRTELNSTALPNFNISATVWLYNLTFSDPRILIDGEICPTTICTEESYSGGILKFNVTSFSVFSAQETPEEPSAPVTTPDEEGGGAPITRKAEFEIDPTIIKVTIKKNETFETTLKIKNTKLSIQNFDIEVESLKEFLTISETEFSLLPEEEKELTLIFSAPEDAREDTYTGKIKISTPAGEKTIPVVLGIESKIVLFDLTLNIPPEYKERKPGEEILFQVSLFSLGGITGTEVSIDYNIKDFNGEVLVELQESIEIDKQASFSKSLRIPTDIADGQYVISANVRYVSSTGTASDTFYVSKVELAKMNKLLIITIILGIVLAILIILWLIKHFSKKIKKVAKSCEREVKEIQKKVKKGHLKLREASRMGGRLRRQHYLLERAYQRGYITKKSYESGKEKIKKTYKDLKEKYL